MQKRWISRIAGGKQEGLLRLVLYTRYPSRRNRHTMGDLPLPTRRQPDREGKCGKNCAPLPTTRLLDFSTIPTVGWPGSLSLLYDLIRWSAQKLDDQIRHLRPSLQSCRKHVWGKAPWSRTRPPCWEGQDHGRVPHGLARYGRGLG